MTVLGVVTARAGSKGIPGKNTRVLGGKPLIAHTIDAARESAVFDRLVLSTDDKLAAAIASARGCEVPFMRPDSLAGDDVPHLPVMQHALTWLRDHDQYTPDWVMILLPTSPLRQPFHIREAIDLAMASGADSVVSVDANGWARLFVDGQPIRRRPGRRQDMPQTWVLNGAVYLFRTPVLFDPIEPSMYGDKVVAYKMSPPYGLNIDDPEDWTIVEHAFNQTAAR